MPPESPSLLTSVALLLGMILTAILIINGLLDMPVKFRSLLRMVREWRDGFL